MTSKLNRYVILVGGAAVGLGGYNFVRSCYFDATIAAYWVQAVGSIAAIIGSMEIFRRQNRAISTQAANQRHADILQRQMAVFAICFAGYDLIFTLCSAHEQGQNKMSKVDYYYSIVHSDAAFWHAEKALAAIPLHELHSYSLVSGILDLRDALAQATQFTANREGTSEEQDVVNFFNESFGYLPRIKTLAERGFTSISEGVAEARARFPEQ